MRSNTLCRWIGLSLLISAAVAQVGQRSTADQLTIRASNSGPTIVGQPTSWTAEVIPVANNNFQYAFRLTDTAGAVVINRSYSANATFDWIPLEDGSYTLTTDAKNISIGQVNEQQTVVSVVSNPQSGTVVAATYHPLVAVYSTTCDSGQVRVYYYPASTIASEARTTPSKQCKAGKRIAFVVGGMQPSTTYTFQSQVVDNASVTMSAPVNFTTGSVPLASQLPDLSIESPRCAASSVYENVILEGFLGTFQNPVAFDNAGNIIWYYIDPFKPRTLFMRPLPGGTMLLSPTDDGSLREVDLAGNILHEITADDASQQVVKLGLPPILNFNHDAVRLPNGNTAVLAAITQVADQGAGPQTVVADMVVVLDSGWNVIWAWNPFNFLPVNRLATLNDVACLTPECGPSLPPANDWLHSNSLQYLPDGNLLISLRSQDWIVKIDYRDGLGTGGVLWKLGAGGDFTTDSTDPYPWFTHQHFATLLNGELTVFDNGNTRVAQNGGNSRGQVWQLDEQSRIAHLTLNVDLGSYSFALGSAQRLGNGNYEFLSGWITGSNGYSSESTEVLPSGNLNFQWRAQNLSYRVFRMTDLYSPENVQ